MTLHTDKTVCSMPARLRRRAVFTPPLSSLCFLREGRGKRQEGGKEESPSSAARHVKPVEGYIEGCTSQPGVTEARRGSQDPIKGSEPQRWPWRFRVHTALSRLGRIFGPGRRSMCATRRDVCDPVSGRTAACVRPGVRPGESVGRRRRAAA